MGNKYLLAVDGSENSQRAAEYLASSMKNGNNNVNITLIHVINSRKEVYRFSPLTDIREIEETVREQGNLLLNAQSHIFEKEGIKVNKVVFEGDAGYEIAKFADDDKFDQIILGTRGLSNFKGIVLGSVSHKVIHFANCPVLLVK